MPKYCSEKVCGCVVSKPSSYAEAAEGKTTRAGEGSPALVVWRGVGVI